MKARKTKDIVRVLEKKGFVLNPNKDHHNFYYLEIEGKKHNIYTYLSHGISEYNTNLMSRIKKQLSFNDTSLAEDFFDCPMTAEEYVKMLIKNGVLKHFNQDN